MDTSPKQQAQDFMAAIEGGSLQPFFDAMADDVVWRWMGVTELTRTFEGKEAVVGGLFGSVAETLKPPYTVTVHHVFADGDTVIVEHTGHNETPDGRRYDNNYCWILRFGGGRIREVREYMDTNLVTATFGPDN